MEKGGAEDIQRSQKSKCKGLGQEVVRLVKLLFLRPRSWWRARRCFTNNG